MSVATTIQPYATIVTPATIAAAVVYVVKIVGPKRVADVVDVVEKDAPAVERAVKDVEQIPAVEKVVEDVEAHAKAEAERLNAATHGAIDALAAELARTVPQAIQDAIVAAHAAAVPPVPVAPAHPAEAVTVVNQ